MAQPTQRTDHARAVFRNTLRGDDAYSRHQRYVRDYLNVYGDPRAPTTRPKTDFDVLKQAHRFIRDDNEDLSNLSYDNQLAVKYYSSLFKEFVICDLKHYKSGRFALRWRIDSEVISGTGQFTCANPRCAYHSPSADHPIPALQAYELPFAYVEDEEEKHALGKAVLCKRCARKLVWKREKDSAAREGEGMPQVIEEEVQVPQRIKVEEDEDAGKGRLRRTDHEPPLVGRSRASRSRSPRGRGKEEEGERYPRSRRRDRSAS